VPAKSQAMQKATAMALHHPNKLYKRNKSLLKMTGSELREYAETRRKGLSEKKGKK
jgi:hypothetical protein